MRFNSPLEGKVNFMYLDVKGWVSTGVGNKIDETAAELSAPSAAERAASLVMANQIEWTAGGVVASEDQVAQDWDTVKSRLDLAPLGHTQFEGITALRVSDEEISRLVADKAAEMETVLTGRPEFVDFATWPASAQIATLSMCWGMGPMFRFPTFQGLVAARDWAGAAEQCHFTPDVGTIVFRNKLDRMHLLNAASAEAQGLPAEQLSVSLAEVLGVQHGLWMLGFDPGPQDGGDGGKTQAGVRKFQESVGLDPNGAWNDPDTQAALAAALGDAGWLVV
jgi:hypothetical protein